MDLTRTLKWYQNGLLHRLDGPAVEFNNFTHEFWIEGVHQENVKDFQETVKLWRVKQVLES